jgi:hypothetical protein
MFAIMLLGWNEFIAVVWNPIYLVLGFLLFTFGWMLYSELDVDARMQQGWIAGALAIWTNLGDALRTVGCACGVQVGRAGGRHAAVIRRTHHWRRGTQDPQWA